MEADLKFKICIFGDFAVGKTALSRRYLTNLFDASTHITLGMEIHLKVLEMAGHTIALQIWDFAGQKRFRYLLPSYARGSFGALFMYDISNRESIKEVEEWLEAYKEGLRGEAEKIPLTLVGGKSDLADVRQVSQNEALNIKVKHGFIDYLECSSKTGENVERIFDELVKKIMKIQGFI